MVLKHKQIIEKLNVRQKINLLTNIKTFADEEYNKLGVPRLALAQYDVINDKVTGVKYPSPESLAASWDINLVAKVSQDIAMKGRENGVTMITVPTAKPRINVYSPVGCSEDPYLSSLLAYSYVLGAHSGGTAVAMPNFSLSNIDIEYLDKKMDRSVLIELLVKPFMVANAREKFEAVVTSTEELKGDYEMVNEDMFGEIAKNNLPPAILALDKVPFDDTVKEISNGKVCFEGFASAVELAFNTYVKLRLAVQEGSGTVDELEAALEDGIAISEDMIDGALDKLIDVAFRCSKNGQVQKTQPNTELCHKACSESIVLLKNQKSVLPLKKVSNLAIIGHMGLAVENKAIPTLVDVAENSAAQYGYSVSKAYGYDMNKDRSDELLNEAVEVAKNADISVVVVGLNEAKESKVEREKILSLPANQIALLNALSQYGDKVIVVVASHFQIDMAFDEKFAGVIYAPIDSTYSTTALIEVLFGKINPSGKLPFTLYENTDAMFAELKQKKNANRTFVGPFIGYRYYDTAGVPAKYPFGYGLSYSQFAYSGLSVSGDQISFTIKNKGSLAGREIAQVYIGKKDSAFKAPLKELKGFVSVDLEAGASETVNVSIKDLTVYNEGTAAFFTQDGVYDIYVCSSVSNVQLTGKLNQQGQVVEAAKNDDLYLYLQSESNIIAENYTLEAKRGVMKKQVISRSIGIVLLILGVIADAAMGVFTKTLMDSILGFYGYIGVMGGGGLIALIGLILTISSQKKIRNAIKEFEKNSDSAINYTGWEKIDTTEIDNMFKSEFKDEEEENDDVDRFTSDNIDAEIAMYIDKDIDFPRICNQFIKYSVEHGLSMDATTARSVLSSVASSRLLLIKYMDDKVYSKFLDVLAGFFGGPKYWENAAPQFTSVNQILFRAAPTGGIVESNFLRAIITANKMKQNVYFACLNNVQFSNLESYFSQFIQYISNPSKPSHITVKAKNQADKVFTINQNLWFALGLGKNESLDNIPSYIADIANVINLELSLVGESVRKTPFAPVNYYQFDYLCSADRNRSELDEDMWKKVDRLEEYVNARAPFHIGNKLCLRTEKFVATFMSCGGERVDALDCMLAGKMLPVIAPILKNKLTASDASFIDTLSKIFGAENIARSQAALKYSTLTITK